MGRIEDHKLPGQVACYGTPGKAEIRAGELNRTARIGTAYSVIPRALSFGRAGYAVVRVDVPENYLSTTVDENGERTWVAVHMEQGLCAHTTRERAEAVFYQNGIVPTHVWDGNLGRHFMVAAYNRMLADHGPGPMTEHDADQEEYRTKTIVRHTAQASSRCPDCGYLNDAERVDYCPHVFHRKERQASFKPHRWVYKVSAAKTPARPRLSR